VAARGRARAEDPRRETTAVYLRHLCSWVSRREQRRRRTAARKWGRTSKGHAVRVSGLLRTHLSGLVYGKHRLVHGEHVGDFLLGLWSWRISSDRQMMVVWSGPRPEPSLIRRAHTRRT